VGSPENADAKPPRGLIPPWGLFIYSKGAEIWPPRGSSSLLGDHRSFSKPIELLPTRKEGLP